MIRFSDMGITYYAKKCCMVDGEPAMVISVEVGNNLVYTCQECGKALENVMPNYFVKLKN